MNEVNTFTRCFMDWWPNHKFGFGLDWFKWLFRPFAERAYLAGRRHERSEIYREVRSLIKDGELEGNGTDKTAERNGIILVSNMLSSKIIDNLVPCKDEEPNGIPDIGERMAMPSHEQCFRNRKYID